MRYITHEAPKKENKEAQKHSKPRGEFFQSFDQNNPTPLKNTLCIVCAGQISDNPITSKTDYCNKTYVFMAHKECWNGISDREKRMYDSCLKETLKKQQ